MGAAAAPPGDELPAEVVPHGNLPVGVADEAGALRSMDVDEAPLQNAAEAQSPCAALRARAAELLRHPDMQSESMQQQLQRIMVYHSVLSSGPAEGGPGGGERRYKLL